MAIACYSYCLENRTTESLRICPRRSRCRPTPILISNSYPRCILLQCSIIHPMFSKVLTSLAITYLLGQATSEACLPNLTCPKEVCSDSSTTLCQCPDLFTECDFSVETCSGELGKCIAIKVLTLTAFEAPVSTETIYTGTTTGYTTIYTSVQTVTETQTDETTSVVYNTEVFHI